ncbi:Pkinase and PH 3 domain containing protein [Trichuris trichiura]|uniref:3-phosphoinositide-dependent protein kinase 1 n=1 Tax=Trichuris trichiura TaxID=36087 RepID=A0A077Z9Z9_TRITR|nr:Pkinase and PH 3 domain containing protein [Trichuris trichiura]
MTNVIEAFSSTMEKAVTLQNMAGCENVRVEYKTIRNGLCFDALSAFAVMLIALLAFGTVHFVTMIIASSGWRAFQRRSHVYVDPEGNDPLLSRNEAAALHTDFYGSHVFNPRSRLAASVESCNAENSASAFRNTPPPAEFETCKGSMEDVSAGREVHCRSGTPDRCGPNDFVFIRSVGEGSFSSVFAGIEAATGRECAIKVCEKQLIRRERKVPYVMREKDAMTILNRHPHPFVVRLFCTFQDEGRLYFVMSFAQNGELLSWLKKLGSFEESVARFYTAEILVALEHLHKVGIIHRDLKPENVLLTNEMHILVSDFGSAKILYPGLIPNRPTPLLTQPSKRASFVGTAQYVSPEVLSSKEATCSCDYWALGCMLYQMLSGLPPFRAPNEYLIFQKITKLDYSFPEGFNEVAMDLVQKLLVLEPAERLGSEEQGGPGRLKEHPFFAGIRWDSLPTEKPPQILPYLPGVVTPQAGFPENFRNLEPGFDDKQLTRLLGLELGGTREINGANDSGISDGSSKDTVKARLEEQRKNNPYHKIVEGHLIIKSGYLEKRKGLFARKRMFLLTEGPHIYYVEPSSMELKGQIPWTKELRPEAKNFKIFFVYTPNRTYYLEDLTGHALDWCRTIEQVHQKYFAAPASSTPGPCE